MPIVNVKFKISDGWELVDAEKVIEIEHPQWHVNGSDVTHLVRISCRKIEPWKQPEFLKPGWIAMNANGSWYWYEDVPVVVDSRSFWQGDGGRYCCLSGLNWTPPVCSDWLESRRKIN